MCGVPRMFEKIYDAVHDRVNKSSTFRRNLFNWAADAGSRYVLSRRDKKTPGILLRIKYLLADLLVFSKVRELFGGRLRLFASGGAHLQDDIDIFFRAIRIPIMHGFGLTEATCTVTLNTLDDFMPGTLGKPLPGVEIRISPDGEILVKGPIVMKGYYNRAKETREALEGGWLHTGDLGYLDKDGYLVMTDRKKDILTTSSGKNISPQRIETLLVQNRYVEQAVIIAEGKKFVSALIVPNFAELDSFCTGKGLPRKGKSDVCEMVEVDELFGEIVDRVNEKLDNFERIKRFAILPNELTIDGGELTHTLKVKRRVIHEKYENIIEKMYME